MTQLVKRLVISAILVSAAIASVFWAPVWFFFVFVTGLTLWALYEFFGIAQNKGIIINRVIGLLVGFLLSLSAYFYADFIFLMLAVVIVFIFHFRPGALDRALTSTSVMIFGILYIPWFCSFLVKLRMLENGSCWVFYTILLTKGGDAAAYFFGKKFGKTKLIQHISPNKTVEGAIAGLAGTVLLSLLSIVYLRGVGFGHLLILGVLAGILALVGDLGESVLKRDAGMKDSGKIPGLGGILDVLDSLILTIPFVYYYAAIILKVQAWI